MSNSKIVFISNDHLLQIEEAELAGYEWGMIQGVVARDDQPDMWTKIRDSGVNLVWLHWGALADLDFEYLEESIHDNQIILVVDFDLLTPPSVDDFNHLFKITPRILVVPSDTPFSTVMARVEKFRSRSNVPNPAKISPAEGLGINTKLLSVVGIAPGVGTSVVSAYLGQRLNKLKKNCVLAEIDPSPTYRTWNPHLHVDLTAPGESWDTSRSWGKYDYMVLDCQTRWSNIPKDSKVVVFVGPGDSHRFHRWEVMAKILNRDNLVPAGASVIAAVGPSVNASATLAMVKLITPFKDYDIIKVPNVLRDRGNKVWDKILHELVT